eukprot:315517-Chlamydomonas_euryale.AAC.3
MAERPQRDYDAMSPGPGGHLEPFNMAMASQGHRSAAAEERIAALEARVMAAERQVRPPQQAGGIVPFLKQRHNPQPAQAPSRKQRPCWSFRDDPGLKGHTQRSAPRACSATCPAPRRFDATQPA